MNRIIAAVDFSDSTDDVIAMTKKIALAFNSKVLVIHTHAPSPVLLYYYGIDGPLYIEPNLDEEIKEEEGTLNILKYKLEKEGIIAECELLKGPTVDNIVNTAKEFKADLIIAGGHKHGALYNFFVGTVSEKLLHKAPCPVMVVPHLPIKVEQDDIIAVKEKVTAER